MGTRSQTVVKTTDNSRCVTLYRQHDGYPSVHGKDLATFIRSGRFVNGIIYGETGVVFNGVGCFAAQLVATLKTGPGGIYLEQADQDLFQHDYTYQIVVNEHEYIGGVLDVDALVGVIVHSDDEQVFFGTLAEFEAFIAADA